MTRGDGADRHIADHAHVAAAVRSAKALARAPWIPLLLAVAFTLTSPPRTMPPAPRVERQIGMSLGLARHIAATQGLGADEDIARDADAGLVDVDERIGRGAVPALAAGESDHVQPAPTDVQ